MEQANEIKEKIRADRQTFFFLFPIFPPPTLFFNRLLPMQLWEWSAQRNSTDDWETLFFRPKQFAWTDHSANT